MICVSLASRDWRECLRECRRHDFVEVRLDLMEVTPAQVRKIFSAHPRLLATCRPGRRAPARRQQLLLAAVEAGAAYLDLELDSSPAWRRPLVQRARRRGCRVILSFHDHRGTPGRRALEQVRLGCFGQGADVAKIACRVNRPRDNARLLALLDYRRPVVVTGMGELGRPTRWLAPLLGSPFTYACLPGKPTAPGQLDHRQLARLLRSIGHG